MNYGCRKVRCLSMSYCSIEGFFPSFFFHFHRHPHFYYFFFIFYYYDRRIFYTWLIYKESPLCACRVCARSLLPVCVSALRNDRVRSGVWHGADSMLGLLVAPNLCVHACVCVYWKRRWAAGGPDMTQNGDSLLVLDGGRQMLLCVFISRHDLKLLQAHMILIKTLRTETCVTVLFLCPPPQSSLRSRDGSQLIQQKAVGFPVPARHSQRALDCWATGEKSRHSGTILKVRPCLLIWSCVLMPDWLML